MTGRRRTSIFMEVGKYERREKEIYIGRREGQLVRGWMGYLGGMMKLEKQW